MTPTLAPDATALGQIYYYVLEPPAGMDLAELRSKQDFFIKYALQSVDGVAEVASIGGYVRQYQIEVDPDKLRYHNIPLSQVIDAVKASNIDVGAKTVETGGMEFIVRGKGFIGSGKTEAGDDRADRKHGRADPRRRSGPRPRPGPGADRPGVSPRRAGLQRPGSGRRRGRDAVRREPARRDRARESEDRLPGVRTGRHQDPRRLRSHGADRRNRRHADRRAAARDR